MRPIVEASQVALADETDAKVYTTEGYAASGVREGSSCPADSERIGVTSRA